MRATANKLYRRSTGEASKYLKDMWGIVRAPATMAEDAMEGRGPPYILVGGRACSTQDMLDTWAIEQLAAPPSAQAKKIKRTKRRKRTTGATEKKQEANAETGGVVS